MKLPIDPLDKSKRIRSVHIHGMKHRFRKHHFRALRWLEMEMRHVRTDRINFRTLSLLRACSRENKYFDLVEYSRNENVPGENTEIIKLLVKFKGYKHSNIATAIAW